MPPKILPAYRTAKVALLAHIWDLETFSRIRTIDEKLLAYDKIMKFGALLRSSAQVMPELQGLFNCYKQLKKRLKRLPEKGGQEIPLDGRIQGNSAVRAHERAFVALLVSDIQAFNETFVEREEQSVIKLSLIEQRNKADLRPDELAALYKVEQSQCSTVEEYSAWKWSIPDPQT